jgi:hypothetical protein
MRHHKSADALPDSGICPAIKAPKPQEATPREKSPHIRFALFFVLFKKTKKPKNRLDSKTNNPEKAKVSILLN